MENGKAVTCPTCNGDRFKVFARVEGGIRYGFCASEGCAHGLLTGWIFKLPTRSLQWQSTTVTALELEAVEILKTALSKNGGVPREIASDLAQTIQRRRHEASKDLGQKPVSDKRHVFTGVAPVRHRETKGGERSRLKKARWQLQVQSDH